MIGQENRYIEDLTQAIRENQKEPGNYYKRGREYHKQHKYNLAIADLNKAVELRSRELSNDYQHRGNAHLRKGDYDNAIADYALAIELEIRDDEIAYFHRGESYAGKGDYTCAILDFTKAMKLKPGQADWHIERGKAYHANGNYDRAISDYTIKWTHCRGQNIGKISKIIKSCCVLL